MRLVRSTFLSLILAGFALVAASAPVMASPGPPRSTATLLSAAQAPEIPELVAVRAAHHPGFDRVVFEFRGGKPSSHSVRYVSSLTEDPTGRPVHLAGEAIIQVVMHGVNAHDAVSGAPTVTPAGGFSPGLPSLKEVALAGDFEAVVSYGLGVDHRVPFKVLELSNPSRLVIDISTTESPSGETATGGSPSDLPFTGARTTGLLVTGLGLAATGLLVLALARRTRTP
ncbi:MAG TPA: hypothetical protein VFA46_22575 [Actinomycetes bacterium]|jgi:hypothetical protein|nr:hypothetical protein [Actinomycetes bacterium]